MNKALFKQYIKQILKEEFKPGKLYKNITPLVGHGSNTKLVYPSKHIFIKKIDDYYQFYSLKEKKFILYDKSSLILKNFMLIPDE